MEKSEIINKYIGSKDVGSFFNDNKSEFEQFHIIDKSRNIKKGKLIKQIKVDLRHLYEDSRNNLFLFCKRKEETSDKTLNPIKCLDKPYFIFKIDNEELFLFGNSRLFFKSFNRYQKNVLKQKNLYVFEQQEKHIKESFNATKFIETLLKLNKEQGIQVYEILLNSLELFSKKIRCQFSSELKKDDILELLAKEELKNLFLKELKIELINSISFKDNKGNQETLKIREIEFGKIEFIWKKKKFSELRKTLSTLFNIYENKTVLYISNGDLDSLFREIEVTAYKRDKIYIKTIEKYADYVEIYRGKARIRLKNTIKSFKDGLRDKYIIEEVTYSKSNNLLFPSVRSRRRNKELLRIKDKTNKKILAYLYLNENALYDDKEKFLRDFFIFMPCLIIDFRRKDNDKYYVSCSEFLKKLKENDTNYFEKIITENKKNLIEDIESTSFKDLFAVVTGKILSNFNNYNKKLKPQRKGEFYEKLVFILFSILFKVERLGGPNKHDGNVFIDNSTFIGYDTKNLTKNNLESFLNKKTKKFKDKIYIKKNNIKHYFFIFENINEVFFKALVTKIKEDVSGEVYIKAFDIHFIKNLFDKINQKGIANYSRTDKQNLINQLLEKKDEIIK
ncbi:hypothetical protein C4573_02195 [Candidatus Woesearchaeota archaeon]|nr:MAG: hypothetical protein C4573_02195 [Candidatus Woesearchaeota archaeon]